MATLMVNPDRLQEMLTRVKEHQHSVLAVQGSTASPVAGNQRSTALVMHLLNQPAPVDQVAILVTPTAVYVCGNRGPSQWTSPVSSPVPITAVDDATFVQHVKDASASLASFPREFPHQAGTWATSLISTMFGADTSKVADAADLLAKVLAVKDATAFDLMRKSGAVASAVYKRFGNDYLVKELSSRTPASQDAAARAFTDMIKSPDRMEGLEQMDTEHFDAAFDANVQCGPTYNLAVSNAPVTSLPLQGPVVNVAVASKHAGYTSYCARTYFVHPVSQQLKDAYNFLYSVYDKVFSLIKPDAKLRDVHQEALAWAKTQNATLAALLSADFGFSTGLHFLDPRGSIGPRATLQVTKGTAVVLRITLEGLSLPVKAEGVKADPDNTVKLEPGAAGDAGSGNGNGNGASHPGTISMFIADTVLVGATGETKYGTTAKRQLDDLILKVKAPKSEQVETKYEPRVTRGAMAAVGLGQEEARNETQRQIFQQKRADWVAAGSPQGVAANAANRPEDATLNGRLARGALQTYPDGIPNDYLNKGIKVDRARHALLLPIGGATVPFHISTITKVDVKTEAGNKHVMTVTFATTQQSNVAFGRHKNRQWIKELTYVRNEGGPLYEVMAGVKEVQKMIKDADARGKQEAGLVKRVALKLRQNPVRLPDVKIRPQPANARGQKGTVNGNLDAHDNGFRFSYPGGEPVDIPYSNIKHFICQPARRDVLVILHCALKQPMLIGDKQHEHVQFYAEVVETSEQASAARRTHDEEVAAEEADERRIKETNQQFAMYAKRVAEQVCTDLKLHFSMREVDFQGVGNKRMTRFRGDQHALWAVSELPFTVVSVDDIEVVSLERVLPGQATFDAFFIHKDYKTVSSITTIAMNDLEVFKDWLNVARLIFFEGTSNVAWTKVLKTMRDDAEWEAWGREGWIQYIDPNMDAEEGEGDEDSDSDEDYEETSGDDDDDHDEESGSDWAEEGESSDPDASTDDSDASDVDSDDDGGSDESEDSGRKRRRPAGKPAVPQRKPPQPGRR
jgi:nucleosome binding factor SPN SPT16 subunit